MSQTDVDSENNTEIDSQEETLSDQQVNMSFSLYSSAY